MAEATTHADLYHRHQQSSDNWEEAEAVTGRENDTPLRGEDTFAVPNTTLADRAKARSKTDAKQVSEDDTEDKAVASSQTKARRSRKSTK